MRVSFSEFLIDGILKLLLSRSVVYEKKIAFQKVESNIFIPTYTSSTITTEPRDESHLLFEIFMKSVLYYELNEFLSLFMMHSLYKLTDSPSC